MRKGNQTKRINLRITPAELKALRAEAEVTGLTLTNVIRKMIHDKLIAARQ